MKPRRRRDPAAEQFVADMTQAAERLAPALGIEPAPERVLTEQEKIRLAVHRLGGEWHVADPAHEIRQSYYTPFWQLWAVGGRGQFKINENTGTVWQRVGGGFRQVGNALALTGRELFDFIHGGQK